MELASCYCLHDDHWFLAASIEAVKALGPVTCFVSKSAWNGTEGCPERAVEVIEALGVEVVLGDWPDETLHRRAALAEMKKRGHRHILIPDGDEVPEKRLLEAIAKLAKTVAVWSQASSTAPQATRPPRLIPTAESSPEPLTF